MTDQRNATPSDLGRSRSRAPRPRRGLIVGAAAVVAGVVAVVVVFAGTRPNGPAAPGEARSQIALDVLTNQEGSYAVSHPPGWSARISGTRTIITSAEGDAVVGVGVGLGSGGTLKDAARTLVASLRRSYDGLRVEARERQRFEDKRALLVSGGAKNLSGVPLRWLAVSLRESERNFTVTIFADASAPPEEVIPPLESIVSSIRSMKP